jgi:hypothetical protein
MAHSRLKGIANLGDAWRITTIGGAVIIELSLDPRVQAFYWEWRRWREDQNRQVHAAIDAGTIDDAKLTARIAAFNAAELEGAQRLVREGLQLQAYPWMAPSLLQLFQIGVHNEAHPEDPRMFSLPVLPFPGPPPKGRRARAKDEDLKRNVRWWYRIQVKGDTVSAVATEYASWANRDNDCRSVVQNGLNQVQAALTLITQRAVRLKVGTPV